MPSFTKKAILASFLHLLSKKPFDKITVRDIVDDCGINRNTFYYYFQDIYAVLEDLLDEWLRDLPEDGGLQETALAFFNAVTDFTLRNPRAAHTLSLSLGLEGMERYLAKRLDESFVACFDRAGWQEQNRAVAAAFVRHALLGFAFSYMQSEKKRDAVAVSEGICAVLGALAGQSQTKNEK